MIKGELRAVSLWEDALNLLEGQVKSLSKGISSLFPKLGLLSLELSFVGREHDLLSDKGGDGGLGFLKLGPLIIGTALVRCESLRQICDL